MHTISIKNIGPIKEIIDLPITPYMLFIGPQASGKSTIAKALYLREKFRDKTKTLFIDFLRDSNSEKDAEELIRLSSFGAFTTLFKFPSPNTESHIDFKRDKITFFRVSFLGNTVSYILSTDLVELIKETLTAVRMLKESNNLNDVEVIQYLASVSFPKLDVLLGYDSYASFIPAARSFITWVGKNTYFDLSKSRFDILVLDFMEEVQKYRSPEVYDVLKKIWDSYFALTENLNYPTEKDDIPFYLILKSMNKIFKGSYKIENNEDRIYFSESGFIGLEHASSGQQEVISIINILTIYYLTNIKVSLTIEEPEAHLFPEAQHELMKLIALFGNKDGNNTTITTHSPYILTSFNNLIYAWQMGQLAPKQVEQEINIPKPIWVNPAHVQAFMVENGEIRSIIDPETKMISISELDSISRTINAEYDKLLDIELKHRKQSEA